MGTKTSCSIIHELLAYFELSKIYLLLTVIFNETVSVCVTKPMHKIWGQNSWNEWKENLGSRISLEDRDGNAL